MKSGSTIVAILLVAVAVFFTECLARAQQEPEYIQQARQNNVLVEAGTSMGNGILIDDQLVLTVAHLQGSDWYVASLPATVLRKSLLYDLALLKAPNLGRSNRLTIANTQPVMGDRVYAVGYAPAFKTTIYASGTVIAAQGGDLLVDFAIFPGNSGSAVYNEENELVGLVSAMQLACLYFCRPVAVVKGAGLIKVFLSQHENTK